jgi:hypothetical protein
MVIVDTAKPATADTRKPASNVEQLPGRLDLENSPYNETSQAETALGAALRAAFARKAVR